MRDSFSTKIVSKKTTLSQSIKNYSTLSASIVFNSNNGFISSTLIYFVIQTPVVNWSAQYFTTEIFAVPSLQLYEKVPRILREIIS